MKAIIITGIIAISLIGGIKYFSTGTNVQGYKLNVNKLSSATIVIDEDNINLGEIPIQGGKVDAKFSFHNEGTDPLVITDGSTSCMCTEAVVERNNGEKSPRIKMPGHGAISKMSMVIEPGETANLIATFDPMAHGPNALGPITRNIFLKTNSETNPEVEFSFQGNVIR